METINGVINRINYYKDDTGYTVAILEVDYKDKNIAMKKAKIIGNTIPVVGFFDRKPNIHEEYVLEGEFIRDSNYGLQFKINSYKRKLIANEEGIISYLSSEMFPGIGPKIAKIIIENIGEDCLLKIKNDPHILDSINLTDKQKHVIITGIISDEQNQENVVFFLDNGITMDMTHKIISLFGAKAKEIVLENPYILMEKIERFGFKKNDAFALKLGIEENSMIRLKALTGYVLEEALYSAGNSYICRSDLYIFATKYINKEIDGKVFNEVIAILEKEKKVYIDEADNIYDYKMYIQEIELARGIAKILKGTTDDNKKPPVYDNESIAAEYQKIKEKSHVEYSKEQEQAILNAFTEPIIIITGGPGTGKTTIIKAIIEMYFKPSCVNSPCGFKSVNLEIIPFAVSISSSWRKVAIATIVGYAKWLPWVPWTLIFPKDSASLFELNPIFWSNTSTLPSLYDIVIVSVGPSSGVVVPPVTSIFV